MFTREEALNLISDEHIKILHNFFDTHQTKKKRDNNKKSVLLGLSGGVDSAVAAKLLQDQGYSVCCAFMRNWDSYTNGDIAGNPTIKDEICSQEKDYQDACAVAESLKLDLLRVDFIKDYWDDVFTDFIREYERGNTPNPDILCNKYIKFKQFFDFAMALGFDYIATGHYAFLIKEQDRIFLGRADDLSKDQSYFLAEVSAEALAKSIFPLGGVLKTEVRNIASELQLKVASKKDSTGICFIGERRFREFLSNYIKNKQGKICNIDTMETIATHNGVMYYTYGQRKGLDINSHKGPWFVCAKDMESNTLFVCHQNSIKWLQSESCFVQNLIYNLPSDLAEQKNSRAYFDCTVKLRYRQPDIRARVHFKNSAALNDAYLKFWQQHNSLHPAVGEDILIEFDHEVEAVSPGQEAVLYYGDYCLGGGRIIYALKNYKDIKQRLQEHLKNFNF